VDTNVSRVLERLFPRELAPTKKRRDDVNNIWALARALLPHRHAYDWNQALMDLGAIVCTAAHPQCSKCPISQACPSAHQITRGTVRRKKQETGRDGIPNRIYRGRIIEYLRHRTNGRGVSVSTIARAVKTNYTTKDETWLGGLIRGLERDGLLATRKRKGVVFLTLPD
jgi:A/G-specific adenine glycosylase